MGFNVGDKVKVVSAGRGYNTYDVFIDEVLPQKKSLWVYGCSAIENRDYTILASHVHTTFPSKGMLHIIENLEKTQVFIIGESGLELVEPALPRICYILGGEDTPLEVGKEFEVDGFFGCFKIDEFGSVLIKSRTSNSWYSGRSDTLSMLEHLFNNSPKIIRNPRLTFTDDEKALMRLHVGAGFPWFARDENGMIEAYEDEPDKGPTRFSPNDWNDEHIGLLNKILPQITWENSPIYIPDYVEGLKND